jgi:hypothetical protein
MRSLLSRALGIAAEVGTAVMACLGCTTKSDHKPEKPREVHWKGQDTGYESTTVVQNDDGGTIGSDKEGRQ